MIMRTLLEALQLLSLCRNMERLFLYRALLFTSRVKEKHFVERLGYLGGMNRPRPLCGVMTLLKTMIVLSVLCNYVKRTLSSSIVIMHVE